MSDIVDQDSSSGDDKLRILREQGESLGAAMIMNGCKSDHCDFLTHKVSRDNGDAPATLEFYLPNPPPNGELQKLFSLGIPEERVPEGRREALFRKFDQDWAELMVGHARALMTIAEYFKSIMVGKNSNPVPTQVLLPVAISFMEDLRTNGDGNNESERALDGMKQFAEAMGLQQSAATSSE